MKGNEALAIWEILGLDMRMDKDQILTAKAVVNEYTQEQLAENTGAKVIITDVSSNDNTYGKDYSIEKYENTKWVELKN